jgi:DNA polymerase (family 10)
VSANWDQIYSYAAEHDIALEINASPMRLDLPDSMVREAAAKGVKFCIDTDAHASDQLDGMPYGVTVARRGWLEPKQVVNTWEPSEFKKWLLGGC